MRNVFVCLYNVYCTYGNLKKVFPRSNKFQSCFLETELWEAERVILYGEFFILNPTVAGAEVTTEVTAMRIIFRATIEYLNKLIRSNWDCDANIETREGRILYTAVWRAEYYQLAVRIVLQSLRNHVSSILINSLHAPSHFGVKYNHLSDFSSLSFVFSDQLIISILSLSSNNRSQIRRV